MEITQVLYFIKITSYIANTVDSDDSLYRKLSTLADMKIECRSVFEIWKRENVVTTDEPYKNYNNRNDRNI